MPSPHMRVSHKCASTNALYAVVHACLAPPLAFICSRKHEWGLNTMPHPNLFGVLKGSEEGACDKAPSAAWFAA